MTTFEHFLIVWRGPGKVDACRWSRIKKRSITYILSLIHHRGGVA